MEADPGAAVHVGFVREIGLDEVRGWMAAQDSAAMLDAMRELPVAAGDAVFVPAGVPHAIGAGILMVEVQEPTDLSVLLEWDGFGIAGADEATLGLGWERALGCVELAGRDPQPLLGPRPSAPVAALLPRQADAFFRAERIASTPAAELAQGFAIAIVLDGAGTLITEEGGAIALQRGAAVLIPWAAGAGRVEGEVAAIVCRPPGDEREVRE